MCQTRGEKIPEICRIYPREERVVGIGNNNIFVIKGIIDYVPDYTFRLTLVLSPPLGTTGTYSVRMTWSEALGVIFRIL